MASKKYTGSCHCGTVKFETTLDLSNGTGKCNCTYCYKSRFWGKSTDPKAFALTAGENNLSAYQFNTKSSHHMFCKTCGVHTHTHGYIEAIGGAFCSVSVACLDNVDPKEVGEPPVHFADGRNDNWRQQPDYTKHL